MPAMPETPNWEDAKAALELLNGLLVEFPFVDEVSRSVALSAFITPIARGAFNVAPMHVANASVAGTGKSYLLDNVAAIAIGQLMPVMAAGKSEEETEKRLGSAMMAAQPLISIDNVAGELESVFLCQAIERPIVNIRILGRSEQIRVEARNMTMFANGNNITVVGDLCRRVVMTTLDAGMERPELREFKSDPIATILDDRGKYIAACLTICRAYQLAGRPNKAKRLASFEGWSDTVRSALIWLGCADPVKSMEATRAEDPETIELRGMLETWADTLGVGPNNSETISDVIKIIVEQNHNGDYHWLDFYTAIQNTAKKRGSPADSNLLGQWARRNKNRIVGGYRLLNAADLKGNKGGSKWWVEIVDADLTAAHEVVAEGGKPTATRSDYVGARNYHLAVRDNARRDREQERKDMGHSDPGSSVDADEDIPF